MEVQFDKKVWKMEMRVFNFFVKTIKITKSSTNYSRLPRFLLIYYLFHQNLSLLLMDWADISQNNKGVITCKYNESSFIGIYISTYFL